MNKRERKSRLKEIVKMIDESITSIESNGKSVIETAQEKIEDLSNYFENHCIMPSSFDADEMIREILIDYFENDGEIEEIKGSIESLREEVSEHIDEMKEGANKEEWEEFYSNLEYIEDIINIEEQCIEDVESFIENFEQLRNNLEDLI